MTNHIHGVIKKHIKKSPGQTKETNEWQNKWTDRQMGGVWGVCDEQPKERMRNINITEALISHAATVGKETIKSSYLAT